MIDFRQLVSNRHPTIWQRLVRVSMIPLAFPYWLAAIAKNRLYEHGQKEIFDSPLPTISVGNLSVGGTGKSPMVAWVARYLRSRGVRVALLSRGYGQLDDGRNDEALELELTLPDVPHLQNPDRIASARLADEELQMQALVLDDGFQHRRMGRDLEIVLLDASEHPRTRHVLPWGLFREPISGLRRADVIVLTRASQSDSKDLDRLREQISNIAKQKPLLLNANHQPRTLLSDSGKRLECSELKGKRVLAFSGIGRPDSFVSTLGSMQAEVVDSRVWPDHHAYQREDIEQLTQWVRKQDAIDYVVCTLKDLVKIRLETIGGTPLFAVAIEIQFESDGEMAFQQMIDTCMEQGLPRSDGLGHNAEPR
ncbi:MAG: tetraacyldisaccharide 4'-kinase [Aureliella sp.]